MCVWVSLPTQRLYQIPIQKVVVPFHWGNVNWKLGICQREWETLSFVIQSSYKELHIFVDPADKICTSTISLRRKHLDLACALISESKWGKEPTLRHAIFLFQTQLFACFRNMAIWGWWDQVNCVLTVRRLLTLRLSVSIHVPSFLRCVRHCWPKSALVSCGLSVRETTLIGCSAKRISAWEEKRKKIRKSPLRLSL